MAVTVIQMEKTRVQDMPK